MMDGELTLKARPVGSPATRPGTASASASGSVTEVASQATH